MAGEGSVSTTILLEESWLGTNWDDSICPICLSFPHNCVLLQCSSYEKGCRPFVCDTDHLHSNCLDRYMEANGIPAGSKSWSSFDSKPACPLCRGEVTGWTVVKEARKHLDVKVRCCEEEKCLFTGTYLELQKHAKTEHPDACPSKVDPASRLDWENFQRSSELIDVLTHIHSEVPNGIILGDYVVEYEEENSGDDSEDLHEDEGNWWRSCIFYQIFGSFTTCRNRRRSRGSESRRGSRRSNSDEGHVLSGEHADNNAEDGDGEFAGSRELSRERSGQRSSRRHLSRVNDN
ncbi:hypothetical protein ACS0TY_022434 [Phlomoides rotata]